ncbi:hypothetical protein SAM19_03821 [Brevibacillus laterosporus]|nr:hypothetical protein [Brevibacillus laterosporus]
MVDYFIFSTIFFAEIEYLKKNLIKKMGALSCFYYGSSGLFASKSKPF